MSVRSHLESQDGYDEYKRLARETPLRDYPWGQAALNIAGITGAHALGYYTAGALAHASMSTPLGKRLAKVPAPQRRRLLAHIIGAAGSAGTIAGSMASLAGQARIAEHLARKEKERQSMDKAAEVREIYARALAEWP